MYKLRPGHWKPDPPHDDKEYFVWVGDCNSCSYTTGVVLNLKGAERTIQGHVRREHGTVAKQRKAQHGRG